jgi:hypothetical protein
LLIINGEMMKTENFLIGIVLATGIFFTSCQKEETPKPEIISFELGHDNSKTGYIGSDLHIDAEILAPGKIDRVKVEIHYEGMHDTKSAFGQADEEIWEFDSVYTEFSGLKNTVFHKDISIPDFAEDGDYHFHFSVTDMEGNQTSIDEELEIVFGEGHSH